MRDLPQAIIPVLRYFELLFSERVWEWANVLLIGAILASGKRTVTAALRVMGLSNEMQFQNYHRVLNRDKWSSRALSRILLRLLVHTFVPTDAPIVIGLDEPIERRRGDKIAAKGIYRDAVRSSKSFFVKTSGLRWVSMMLLAPIPWAKRVWALPFLTVLAPAERYHQERGQRHKTLADWAQQMITQVRRWLPERAIVVVADNTYAVLELRAFCVGLPTPVTMITRLRLDAAWYDPAPPREPGKRGAPRKKGERQPTLSQRLADPKTEWERLSVAWYGRSTRSVDLASGTAVWYHGGLPVVPRRWVLIRDGQGKFEPQALLRTDLPLSAQQIVEWFVLCWQLEVTFEEARASGRGNPAPVVGSGDRADHAGVVGTLFAHHLVRASVTPWTKSSSGDAAETLPCPALAEHPRPVGDQPPVAGLHRAGAAVVQDVAAGDNPRADAGAHRPSVWVGVSFAATLIASPCQARRAVRTAQACRA